jgi:hypothetical protein
VFTYFPFKYYTESGGQRFDNWLWTDMNDSHLASAGLGLIDYNKIIGDAYGGVEKLLSNVSTFYYVAPSIDNIINITKDRFTYKLYSDYDGLRVYEFTKKSAEITKASLVGAGNTFVITSEKPYSLCPDGTQQREVRCSCCPSNGSACCMAYCFECVRQ